MPTKLETARYWLGGWTRKLRAVAEDDAALQKVSRRYRIAAARRDLALGQNYVRCTEAKAAPPIPKTHGGKAFKWPFHRMEVGEFMFFPDDPDRRPGAIPGACTVVKRRFGFVFVTRTELPGDDYGFPGVTGTGVWRTE